MTVAVYERAWMAELALMSIEESPWGKDRKRMLCGM